MKCLLDTHFLLWIITGAARLAEFDWLERYGVWGVSPVSLLELKFLGETGRLDVRMPEFLAALQDDARFVLDEVPLLQLISHSLPLAWTRDPFDRLLAAHSSARRVPLISTDRRIRRHHVLLPEELKL